MVESLGIHAVWSRFVGFPSHLLPRPALYWIKGAQPTIVSTHGRNQLVTTHYGLIDIHRGCILSQAIPPDLGVQTMSARARRAQTAAGIPAYTGNATDRRASSSDPLVPFSHVASDLERELRTSKPVEPRGSVVLEEMFQACIREVSVLRRHGVIPYLDHCFG